MSPEGGPKLNATQKIETTNLMTMDLETAKRLGFEFGQSSQEVLGLIAAQPDKFFDAEFLGNNGKFSEVSSDPFLFKVENAAYESIYALKDKKIESSEEIVSKISEIVEGLRTLADSFKKKKMFGLGGPDRKTKDSLIERVGKIDSVLEKNKITPTPELSNLIHEMKQKMADYCTL